MGSNIGDPNSSTLKRVTKITRLNRLGRKKFVNGRKIWSHCEVMIIEWARDPKHWRPTQHYCRGSLWIDVLDTRCQGRRQLTRARDSYMYSSPGSLQSIHSHLVSNTPLLTLKVKTTTNVYTVHNNRPWKWLQLESSTCNVYCTVYTERFCSWY